MFGKGRTHIFHFRRAEDWGKEPICKAAAQPSFEGGCRVPVSISCLFSCTYKCVLRLIVSAYN